MENDTFSLDIPRKIGHREFQRGPAGAALFALDFVPFGNCAAMSLIPIAMRFRARRLGV